MLDRIIDGAIRHRLLIGIALIALMGLIALSLEKLNLDAFPDVTNIQVSVNTESPGLAAEEVEQLITFPIESVMYAMADVKEVRSISKTGLSIVTVVFNDDMDIYFARQQVFERLQQAKEMIPANVGMPVMGPNTSGLGQIYQYTLSTQKDSNMDAMTLRSLNDWVVKLLLMPVDGVTDVLSFGGDVRQYQVNVKPSRLLAYDLSLADVQAAIERNNRNAGGWYMDRGQEQLVIRGVGWIGAKGDGLRDIANIPLKTIDGTAITVGDLAEVKYGGEIRQGAVTMTRRNEDGHPQPMGEVVAGIVLKRMGSNTQATIEAIENREKLIRQAMPDGVEFNVYYNQSELILKAVNTVTNALLQAFVFIVLVLALFLMNLRATFLVLLSIPLSIGLALMVMSHLGLSANLMSLGGLAVAIGMLVDGSVVMVENIFKRLNRLSNDPDQNTDTRILIRAAAKEVAKPIVFAALIILLVFAPLFSLEGVEAKLFQPMAISIMLALMAALIVAIVVVPALASYLFRHAMVSKPSPVLKPIEKAYHWVLSKVSHRPKLIAASALAMFITALGTLPFIGTEFVPELEEGTLNIRVTLAPSASLDTALSVAPKLEEALMTFPEVTYTLSRVGRPEIGGDPEPVSNIEIYVGLKSVNEWTSAGDRFALQHLMEEKLSKYPGILLTFSQPIVTRVDELLSGVKAQLAIKLIGPDLDTLASKGQEITNVVQQIKGTTGVAMEQIQGEAQLVVRPDRKALSRFGLSIDQVMDLVEIGLGGVSAGQVINGNERYDIYLRLNKDNRRHIDDIKNLRIKSNSGAIVRLADVATVNLESGPPQIRRDDVQRRVVVQANVEGRDMGSVVADIQQSIDEKIDLPAGYSVDIGGQFENQQRAQKKLMLVVPVSILLIALLLFLAFNSVAQTALILLNVPLALVGGILALWVSGHYLSVPSSVGFITLFGLAVLNGVVMVENINDKIKNGLAQKDAVLEGAKERLRPVLMTAITSALGLIPMLVSQGVGSEIQKPLAVVIIGGLISATLLTLVVIPTLYPWFNRQQVKVESSS